VGLVALSLVNIPPSTYFQPDELLHRISLMPQLEVLWITFDPSSSRKFADLDVTDMHNATHISLPNLRFFHFVGFNTYSEAFLSQIAAPHLEAVTIAVWEHWVFPVRHLLEFLSTSEDLQLGSASFTFDGGGAKLLVFPNETARVPVLDIHVRSSPGHMVSDAAQISNALSPLFSSVVCLTLDYKDNWFYPVFEGRPNPADWRALLRSFSNVKILFLVKGVVGKLSRSLQLDDGGSPNDLLPELDCIMYSPSNDNADEFTEFLDARQNAGRPVALVHLEDAASTPS
jgi:hypothetical protein